MRLDKMLADCRIGSRKEIKQLVREKLVTVNGKIVADSAMHIEPDTCEIKVRGSIVEYKKNIYLMLNKPPGVVSATEDNLHTTVIDLLEEPYSKMNLYPVGRLDIDTEGLIFMTNDGKLAHIMISPKHHVEKEYFARVSGEIKEEHIQKFQEGIILDDGYKTLPAKLIVGEAPNEALVIISEGKFHQIKRMFADCGMKVLYLKRVRMGSLLLDNRLESGEYRELTNEEEKALKSSSLTN